MIQNDQNDTKFKMEHQPCYIGTHNVMLNNEG